MIIGILKELNDEKRVSFLPEGVQKLKNMQFDVLVENDAGLSARAKDERYAELGATIVTRKEVFEKADIISQINPPTVEDISAMRDGQILMSMFFPLVNHDLVKELKDKNVSSFSMDMIPRITRAQSMDVLSSMATVAGYKSVIAAAEKLPYFFPMLMTAAGTIKPARVLVLGAGVAGLMAIATAKRLGAEVKAFDVRSAVKEQVESLGGKFVEIEGAKEDKAAGGYAVEQSEGFKQKQKDLIHQQAINSEVIICTAQIPGKKAPILITKNTVDKMHPASIIIDIASSTGGNCELTQDDDVIYHNQVTIVGNSNFMNEMPSDSSKMWGNNLINFLRPMIDDKGNLEIDLEDEIISGTCITHKGEIISKKVKSVLK